MDKQISEPIPENIILQNQEVKIFFESSAVGSLVLNEVFCSIVVLNNAGQIIYCNKIFKNIADNNQQVLGKRFGTYISCSNVADGAKECGQATFCNHCTVNKLFQGTAEIKEYEISFLQKNNKVLEFLVRPVLFEVMSNRYTLLIIKDISNEKRRRMLERIFFHDISNTMTIMNGHLLMLEKDKNNSIKFERVKKTYDKMWDEVKGQKILADAENGELQIRFSPIEIRTFIQEIIILLQEIYKENRLLFEFDHALEGVVIETDETILRRVIINMIKNAIEASNKESLVTIKTHVDKKYVKLMIHNEGYIPEEIQAKIFKRSFSTKGKGRGLGTYSMKLFTEKYLSGMIDFESLEKSGTTFLVKLPRT